MGLVSGMYSVSLTDRRKLNAEYMLTAIADIGDDNQLKQRSNSNTSSLWSDGPLNAMNLTVLDADQVGMQACWYGNAYGDTDYIHSDRPSTGSTAASSEIGEFDSSYQLGHS